MSKFKADDKVISTKTGKKGVVQWSYGTGEYAVTFDDPLSPEHCYERDLKAANSLPVSRNSVVANAVAAQGVAKNSEMIDQGKFPSGVSVDIREHNGKKFCDFTVYTDGIMSGYGVARAQETLKLLKGKVSSLEKAIAFVKSKYPEYIG